MRRKRIVIWICGILTVILSAAGAEADIEIRTGMILEISETGFQMYTGDEIMTVMITESTGWDTDGILRQGDMVVICSEEPEKDGVLYADHIIDHRIRGCVTEVTEGQEPYLLLNPGEGSEWIRVNTAGLPMRSLAAGSIVDVYYDGIMTRSIPAQITALYIRGTVLGGKVLEIGENGELLILGKDGEKVLLHVTEDTLMPTEPKIGNEIKASVFPQMRLSLPAQYEAQDILVINEKE